MTFQYVLVAALLGFAIYLGRLGGLGRARKVAIFMLLAAMLVFAIRPEWSTDAARWVGISRGVDLLFYLSNLALFFLAFVYFLKLKRLEMRMTRLVRQLALEPGRVQAAAQSEPTRADPA